ncbi:uncharacterized protein LAESUDRAFT_450424 [Laetiporus sulphureus 93-53]|uniref:Uncharacterized protein n=1 Tax=Laetiporus sulphureus 93-53 TaxID=1314785 RepID=A0A165BWJ6_9APHY|nr:uncharacterized protein LAESUDRAFT_450424 [Laetiporus sulphureus 93-53]KZT01781.1 hypothetical protein LAESUDRAFT_450424 [Laetiporus sulphureus 93-53]
MVASCSTVIGHGWLVSPMAKSCFCIVYFVTIDGCFFVLLVVNLVFWLTRISIASANPYRDLSSS